MREELTLVHRNPCAAQTERDSTCDSHMHNALSGPKQFGKDAKTRKNRQYVPNTRTHARLSKNSHCAQAAMRQTVLSVLGHDHEEGMKNLH